MFYNYKIKMDIRQRTRVLFVITKSVWGGAQRYVFDVASRLPKDTFEASIAAGPNENIPTALLGKSKEAGISFYTVKHFQKSIHPLKELWAFIEILRIYLRFKPDIIHANSSKAGGIAGAAAMLYKIVTRRKILCVFTVHGWGFLEDVSPLQKTFRICASKATTFFYNTIICVSERDRVVALKNNIAKTHTLVVIRNGIEETIPFLPRADAQKELLGKEHALVVGCVAEFTKNKGLEYLIEALPFMLKRYPELKLCLVGWGEYSAKLKALSIKLQIENSVFFVSKSPVAPYLKAFDIFVLPSLKEGLPYALLEAGLAEVPAIATNVGGIPEIIEDRVTGILVQPKSVRDIENAILYLASNNETRKKMGAVAKEHIQKNFSLSNMMEHTLEIYQST